ncbi:MAG: tRNA (guanosine(46)-N7)-methyltransferase TrmB [Bacteroidales bacterium]|nr:tRNA (guanosine(46)-N7)-methyltransferase TrmB [Bacteroidales bacterium]MBN2698780.1 tRNA (guanosine(46)-N7)-methyltransferase TrmB [Bacteroidales bacterium]
MGKNKLSRFEEMLHFDRVFQPSFHEVYGRDYYLKGCWSKRVFHNNNPIILELGCGKGEYTIGMAKLFPRRNFIGIDIKGARIWKGAKIANDTNLSNTAFLRTRIEWIQSYFGQGEIDEIWITFPDPQLKRRRKKKRLTGALFLNSYRNLLKDNGIIHLKTDHAILYNDTLSLLKFNGLEILMQAADLYSSPPVDPVLSIPTFYESQFLEEGIPIRYVSFKLPSRKEIIDLEDEEA